MSTTCPLCLHTDVRLHAESRTRPYLRCQRCLLIFVPAEFHLDQASEKAIYDQHQNRPDDPHYRNFLDKLATPLQAMLKPGMRGLDFGCGPGPTLSLMLRERGYPMAVFDPYYANDASVLNGTYDFITATEVIEHVAQPADVLRTLFDLLPTHGVLGLMTRLVPEDRAFTDWHYQKDPTHICFYSEATFRWIATHWQRQVMFLGVDVILLKPLAY